MTDILKKLRKYEIRIRKAINSRMQGDFHSIFKGSGLEFDGVRTYQYGDDIRAIDWNVSAKGHGTFVKTFIEEKEQTVLFMLDVSASQGIGPKGSQKIDLGKEITALLSLSAFQESSQVGLFCFSDQKERYVKPGKGMKHSHSVLSAIFDHQPKSKKTSINEAIRMVQGIIKRRAVLFLISDFIDENYEHSLKGLARKHDLIVIQLFDKRETKLPGLGIIPLHEKESGKTIWVNSSSGNFRSTLNTLHRSNATELEKFCRRTDTTYLSIETGEDYIPKLIRMFRHRNKTNGQSAR